MDDINPHHDFYDSNQGVTRQWRHADHRWSWFMFLIKKIGWFGWKKEHMVGIFVLTKDWYYIIVYRAKGMKGRLKPSG